MTAPLAAAATPGEAGLSSRTQAAQDKARVLREALPWINRWSGRTLVVKYGGSAITDAGAATVAADVALLSAVGVRVVVVHGGGPQISALGARLGLQPAFAGGRRITDAATLEAVRLALLGEVNPRLVALLQQAGAPAAGVAGTDGGLLEVTPVPELGLVGDVSAVHPRVLRTLLADGLVPVVAGLGSGPDGQSYNVNADSAAAAVAGALAADKLIYLTDVAGLYADFGTPDSTLLPEVSVETLRRMLADGRLHTGMVPKITGVVAAMDAGVAAAHLLDGRVEHALLLEIFTDEGIGTMVTAS